MEIREPFNPLDKRNLGFSVAEAMLAKKPSPLPPSERFAGAGIYAIYYTGDHPVYCPISQANKEELRWPIYVGKAIPKGGRKGGFGLDALTGSPLFDRLSKHARSIQEGESLRLEDFQCRHLVVDDIWIPLGESLLIEMSQPLWNVVVEGFGNNDPGAGRYAGQRPSWDTLHPGRAWATKCVDGKPLETIEAEVKAYFMNCESQNRRNVF
jgi:hypothetical protein